MLAHYGKLQCAVNLPGHNKQSSRNLDQQPRIIQDRPQRPFLPQYSDLKLAYCWYSRNHPVFFSAISVTCVLITWLISLSTLETFWCLRKTLNQTESVEPALPNGFYYVWLQQVFCLLSKGKHVEITACGKWQHNTYSAEKSIPLKQRLRCGKERGKTLAEKHKKVKFRTREFPTLTAKHALLAIVSQLAPMEQSLISSHTPMKRASHVITYCFSKCGLRKHTQVGGQQQAGLKWGCSLWPCRRRWFKEGT